MFGFFFFSNCCVKIIHCVNSSLASDRAKLSRNLTILNEAAADDSETNSGSRLVGSLVACCWADVGLLAGGWLGWLLGHHQDTTAS